MAGRVTLAREIAFDAFIQVMQNGKKPEDALDDLFKELGKDMKRVDKNLATEIVYGSLRWYSKIFWILQNTSSRNLEQVSPEVRAALVLGTYQIFYLDRVPDRASVNESVEYIRKKGQASAVSFVNGILRQIARRAEYFAKPDKVQKPVEYLSLQFAHPHWMVSRWLRRFRFDKMEVLLASNNKVPPFFVRMNILKTPGEKISDLQHQLLKEEHIQSDRQNLRSCLILKKTPDLGKESLFGQGYYTVQDQAAQLISHLVDPKPDEVILDATCGPGGKITHLYELSEGKAKITGVEKNPSQMTMVKENIDRLGFTNIELIQGDYLEFAGKKASYDKILLDAPCSALGVLRRHPDAKWHKKESLIKEMAELQRKMIEKSLSLLKVGGELTYAVCSYESEESEDHLAWLSKHSDKVEIVSPVSRLPDYFKRYVTRDNLLMIFSGNQDEMDGFSAFIVKLKAPW